MNRRGFFGTLAALIVARKLPAPEPVAFSGASWPAGLIDLTTTTSVHGLYSHTGVIWDSVTWLPISTSDTWGTASTCITSGSGPRSGEPDAFSASTGR